MDAGVALATITVHAASKGLDDSTQHTLQQQQQRQQQSCFPSAHFNIEQCMLHRRVWMIAHNIRCNNNSSSSSPVFRLHTFISKSQHTSPLLLITGPRCYHRCSSCKGVELHNISVVRLRVVADGGGCGRNTVDPKTIARVASKVLDHTMLHYCSSTSVQTWKPKPQHISQNQGTITVAAADFPAAVKVGRRPWLAGLYRHWIASCSMKHNLFCI